MLAFVLYLRHVCSKQELWSQRNRRCLRTALKQHSFLGNGCETDNGMKSVAGQQTLKKLE
jgi:hypothetical protein